MSSSSIIGINPAAVTDYTGDLTFANCVKHSRGFNTPGAAYDYHGPALDSNFQPTGDFGMLFALVPGVIRDSNGNPTNFEPILDGRYGIRFTGRATVTGGAVVTYDSSTNVTTGYVDLVASQPSGLLSLDFDNTRRLPSDTTNTGITDLHIMRPIAQGSTTYHNWDELFSRQFLQAIAPFRCIRALDICGGATNGATPANSTTWAARQLPANPVQSNNIAYEYAIMMANANSGADLWMVLPVYADDDHITKFFQLCLYGSDGVNPYTTTQANPVYPPLQGRILFTFGNEVWNDQFSCTSYVKNTAAPAAARANPGLNFTTTDINLQAAQYCAYKTVLWRDLAAAVYGESNFGVRFCPIFESQLGDETSTTFGTVHVGLDMVSRMDGRPVNKKLWGSGASWYHEPPALRTAKANWTGVYPTPAQTFAVAPSGFPAIPALFNLVHSYGLRLVNYEGGEVFENDVDIQLQPIYLVQNDPGFAPYVGNAIGVTVPYSSIACVYGLTQTPWSLCRSTNDLTSNEATKFKATVAAIAANAGVSPPSGYPAFAPISQQGWSDTGSGGPPCSTGMVTFAADTLIEASIQGFQPAAGDGVGLFVDGGQVAKASLPINGQFSIDAGGRVRMRTVVPAGNHTVEIRNLQVNTTGYGSPISILPLASNTVETDTLLYNLDLTQAANGADLSTMGWTHAGGPAVTFSKSQNLFLNATPGQEAVYTFNLSGLGGDYAIEGTFPGTFTSAGAYNDGSRLLGRVGTSYSCQASAFGGFMNLIVGSVQANSRFHTVPGKLQLRCVGGKYTALVEGFEVCQIAGTGPDAGGTIAIQFGSSQLSELKVFNIATSSATSGPTTIALTLPASSTPVGTAGTATVTLSGGPASTSPIVVNLAYSGATGPSTVTVPAGSLTASFSVTPTATTYTVTPTANGLAGPGAVAGAATASSGSGSGLTAAQAAALAQIPGLVAQVTSLSAAVAALPTTILAGLPTATIGSLADKAGFGLAASGLDSIVVEAGINARQALVPILAASAGVVAGAGTGLVVIKGGKSSTTRITATTDNAGNRSSVTLNLPS